MHGYHAANSPFLKNAFERPILTSAFQVNRRVLIDAGFHIGGIGPTHFSDTGGWPLAGVTLLLKGDFLNLCGSPGTVTLTEAQVCMAMVRDDRYPSISLPSSPFSA